jgi:acetoacetate decarboxylase
MAGGREFHRRPKRIAEIGVQTIGDLHVSRVRHNGTDIFTGTMQYKASTDFRLVGGRILHDYLEPGF